jgi:hypothetical protein
MSETRTLIKLLRMYFQLIWEFGSALYKLRNVGGVESPPPLYATRTNTESADLGSSLRPLPSRFWYELVWWSSRLHRQHLDSRQRRRRLQASQGTTVKSSLFIFRQVSCLCHWLRKFWIHKTIIIRNCVLENISSTACSVQSSNPVPLTLCKL